MSGFGPCYLSLVLKEYLEEEGVCHTRGKLCHPMPQGKIERYHHRSMNNIVLLENYYNPDAIENQIGLFVEYYNYHRYHEALNNLTPADFYYGRSQWILI